MEDLRPSPKLLLFISHAKKEQSKIHMKSGHWGKNQLRENKQKKTFPECNGKLHWNFSDSNLDWKKKKMYGVHALVLRS